MRRVLELHWPALLVGAACAGIALGIRVSASLALVVALALVALAVATVLDGPWRVAVLGVALAMLGLGWGSLRMDALRHSVLVAEIGRTGVAELVTLAPARSSSFSTRVIAETRHFRGESVRERVLLVLPLGRSPPRGAVLRATVRVAEPRPKKDGFDERAWLGRQGIHVVLDASSWQQVGRRGGILGLGDRLRDRVERAIDRGTDGVRRGIVLGVVLGEDEGLPADVQSDFRASGLYHLLAVSGQNIAFLAAGVYGIGWLLRLSRLKRELLVVFVIAAYVLAVGWQPSVIRAAVAGGLASLAWVVSRPRDRWHFLAVGALVLMVWMPTSVLEPGFQLSFAAVAAIFVAVPRMRRVLDGYPLSSGVADALSVSLACGLVTAPIVLFHFGQAPVYTVIANVVAFVAAPLVLGLGLLAAIVDPVSPSAAAGFASLAGWAAAWLEVVARVVAVLPGARVGTRSATLLALGGGALWLGVRSARARMRTAGSIWLAVALLAVPLATAVSWVAARPAPAWDRPAGLRVTFLDVGQGDSTLLETPSARVLVDEGPPEANVAGQLRRLGVLSLSAIVMTHPQRDHVGGAADVIRRIHVGEVLEPGLAATGPESEEALAVARGRGVHIVVVRAGTRFRAGGLVLDVLWPNDAGSPSEDPNQNAVVLIASYGETDVYLSADAESDVTARLPLRAVEIMKVAHHGSEDPGLSDELRTLRPRIAVISCGKNNDYGHPRPETLAALAGSPGLAVYRTDEDGRVVVESDGRRLAVHS
ncbi:MAG TPA: ComEC/Rec2 family competence protein [Gaiellaceae bacterium]|nr:ComEC/Rec2 family competence protein [Gaiellaceae bacterium]